MPVLRPLRRALPAIILAVGIATALLSSAGPSAATVGGASAVALLPCANGRTSTAAQPCGTPAWQLAMLQRVNAMRAAVGAPPVALCARLGASAQKYAHVMASQDYFAHLGPDGRQPWDRDRAEGYRWKGAAENLAAGQLGVAAVVTAWRESPGHYTNLVNPAYTHVGFGYSRSDSSHYKTYWVQEFGFGGRCKAA